MFQKIFFCCLFYPNLLYGNATATPILYICAFSAYMYAIFGRSLPFTTHGVLLLLLSLKSDLSSQLASSPSPLLPLLSSYLTPLPSSSRFSRKRRRGGYRGGVQVGRFLACFL